MKRRTKIILLSVIALCILGVIVAEDAPQHTSKIKPNQEEVGEVIEDIHSDKMQNMAYTIIRLAVKKQLPSSQNADFPALLNTQKRVLNDSSYMIDAYVDTKNANNADQRVNFSGTVKYLGGNYDEPANWQLVSLREE